MKSFAVAAIMTVALAAPAKGTDKVRLVSGHTVIFETEHPYSALEGGIFRKYGLDVSIVHGSSAAESMKSLVTGTQDIIYSVDALSVLRAYASGKPVRILGSTMRGTGDFFWYVKHPSPIKRFTDLKADQELTYSRPGSVTALTALLLHEALNLKPALISAGGLSATRDQVLAGQIATGWSVFPFNGKYLRERKIRIIGTGSQATGIRGVSVRVIAANARWLDKNRSTARRLIAALSEGQVRSYSNDQQLRAYALRWNLKYADVQKFSEFVPLTTATFLPVGRIDRLNEIAVRFKQIQKPLTPAQLKELVHPLGNKPG